MNLPFVAHGKMSAETVHWEQSAHRRRRFLNGMSDTPILEADSLYMQRVGPCSSLLVYIQGSRHIVRHALALPGLDEREGSIADLMHHSQFQ